MNCCSNTPKQNSTKRKSFLILNAQGRHGKAWSVDKDRIFANALSFWWKENEGGQHCHRCPNYWHSLQRVHIGRQQSKNRSFKIHVSTEHSPNKRAKVHGRKERISGQTESKGRAKMRAKFTNRGMDRAERGKLNPRANPTTNHRANRSNRHPNKNRNKK